MALRSVEQLALDEITIEDPELEELLETRDKRKASASATRADLKLAHDAVVVALTARDELSEEQPIRVGRFRITKKTTPARSVSFDTEPKTRIAIEAVDDDD